MPDTANDVALFDLDNTLIPFLSPLRRWAETWAETASPEEPDPVREALLDVTLEETEDTERAIRVVSECFDLHDVAPQATQEAQRAYWRALTPYPGIRGTLAALARSDVRLGIVTDAPRKRAAVRLAATQLTRFFDVVVTRDETDTGKTSPRPFQLALDALDAEPAKAVMVGDWPAFDIRWPNRMGMRSVLAAWGMGALPERARCKAEPWFEAHDPRQLRDLVIQGRRPQTPPTTEATVEAGVC